jgi:putative phosphoribosyl transferase
MAPHDWTERLGEEADELICLHSPRNFFAIGQFYKIDFSQSDGDDAVACLEEALALPVSTCRTVSGHAAPEDREVDSRSGAMLLRRKLTAPRVRPASWCRTRQWQ